MTWLDWLVNLLASREWLLIMTIVIVIAAFKFPDYRMGEDDEKDRDKRD